MRGALVAAIVLSAGVARAQEASVAEQLYKDGQKLIAAGKTHEACLKFADSERADPALGTLIALAACHEREGKVASAWSEFGEAGDLARRAHDATRARFARTHAAALEPKVHRVRIDVTPPVAGVSVELAGKTYGEGTLGSAIPLDPGDYALEVRAQGKKPFSRALHVEANGGEEHVTVTLEDVPAEPAPKAAPPEPPPPPPRPPAPEARGGSGARVAGYVTLAAGAALGVVAVVLEASAASQSSRAADDAQAANAARDPALYDSARSERDDALAKQRVALVAGGVGLAAIAVGAFLVLGSPSVRVAPTASGLGLGGVF